MVEAARVRVAAVGKFDALHLGHRALAGRAQALGEATLLGFSGMAGILGWPARLPIVATSDRARVLDAWAVSESWLPFAEIQPLDVEAFVRLLATRLRFGAVVVGEDFRCGRGRAAGIAELQAAAGAIGLGVEVVPQVRIGGSGVSSSRVRAALARGDVAEARTCLGRPHRVVGVVARGDGRGRTIGFPTANCAPRENQEPATGVYAAMVEVDGGRHPAAVNVGRAPTVGADRPVTVEAHLLDFSRDCYGSAIGIDFIARLRDERRFPSLVALRDQLVHDVAHARRELAAEA